MESASRAAAENQGSLEGYSCLAGQFRGPKPDIDIDRNDQRYVSGYIFPFHYNHPVTGKEASVFQFINVIYYNYSIRKNGPKVIKMRKKKTFIIINEIVEALSLSNKTRQLLDATLDTLMNVKNIHSCWVQLLLPEKDKLKLTAHRNFSKKMIRELNLFNSMNGIDVHVFGLGNNISISNLPNDTRVNLSSFVEEGLFSVAIVPLRTYHTRGILGVASRVRDCFDKDFTDVLLLIGNIVCAALDKADLYQRLEDRVSELEQGIKYVARENGKEVTADREYEETTSDQETAISIKGLEDLAGLAEEYHRKAHSAIKDVIVEAKEMDRVSIQLNRRSAKRPDTSEGDIESHDHENNDAIGTIITQPEFYAAKNNTPRFLPRSQEQAKESVLKDELSLPAKSFEIHSQRMNQFRKSH